jgi:hypothetical protein
MTKRRAPLTFDAALARVAGQVPGGFDALASHAGRQIRTVRNWGDPDTPEQIPADVMVRFDLLFSEAGGEGSPFFEAYAAQLEIAASAQFADRHELLARTERLLKEAGEAHAALVRACQPDATAADEARANREAAEAFEAFKPVLAFFQARISARERGPP